MSEAERRKRQEYKRKRLRWITVQAIAIALVAIVALGSFLIYDKMNSTYYIEYTEQGAVDYKVHYRENSFYDDEWIGPGNAYVSSLVDGVLADFKYDLSMSTSAVSFDYSYSVDAQIFVVDRETGDPLYSPTYEITPEKTQSASGSALEIRERIEFDYVKHNREVKHFVDTYGITDANSHAAITLRVNVLSKCEQFEGDNNNSYYISLIVPLNHDTFDINYSSSAVNGETKVLACNAVASQKLFGTVGICASALTVLLGIVLIAFAYLTRNEDVNYTIKVQKIVKAYRSFIQQIDGEFNAEGYQIVSIKSFVEMLGIRDTIQSPVLMFENEDHTKTEFLIPTNTKILYVFDVKVDNYDEIYGIGNPVEEIEEVVILDDSIDAEELAEAIAAPDVKIDEVEFDPDDDDDFAVADDEPGVEVVGVVWPERPHKNKVYRYDPAGEQLAEGDVVLVPTRDAAQDREVIRKAAVAHANHRVEEEHIKHPLKKIIGIVKRRVAAALTDDAVTEENNEDKI